MFRRNWKEKVKENAPGAFELGLQLARDEEFRTRLRSAVEHSREARRRARRGHGLAAAARRLAADETLQAELRDARRDLQQAYALVNAKRRGRRLRRVGSLVALASLAAVPQVRERISALIATASKSRQHLQGLTTANEPGTDKARPRSLDDLTKEELYARAQEKEIPGRSEMSKEELVSALRANGS